MERVEPVAGCAVTRAQRSAAKSDGGNCLNGSMVRRKVCVGLGGEGGCGEDYVGLGGEGG